MFSARWRPILWSAIFVFIILSISMPLSILTISFVMIPLLIMYVTLSLKSFLVHFAVSLGIIVLLTGQLGISLILISLFFLGPVLVIGHLYKKETPAHVVIAAGIISLLVDILLIFLLFASMGINLVTEATEVLEESFLALPEVLQQNISEDEIDEAVHTLTQMIPIYMIGFAVYYMILTHWIGRKLLKRMGYPIAGLRPIKEWMLPKALVWYYLIALILSYTMDPESDSILVMILLNIIPILMVAFCIQAVSFLFFVVDIKKWSKVLPIVGIVGCLFFPQLISLLGVFDVLFQIRKNIQKQ